MKKMLALILLSSQAMADCDWSKGITPGPNKTFIYSEACHQAVGKLVEDHKADQQRIADFVKAVSLKDTALADSDAKVKLWMDTSLKMEDSLTRYEDLRSKNQWLWFGLGVVATGAAAYTASKLSHH